MMEGKPVFPKLQPSPRSRFLRAPSPAPTLQRERGAEESAPGCWHASGCSLVTLRPAAAPARGEASSALPSPAITPVCKRGELAGSSQGKTNVAAGQGPISTSSPCISRSEPCCVPPWEPTGHRSHPGLCRPRERPGRTPSSTDARLTGSAALGALARPVPVRTTRTA